MSLDETRCLTAKNATRFNPSHRYLVPYDVQVDHVAWSDSDQLAVLSGYDDAPEGIDSAWCAAARGARSVLQRRRGERTLVNGGHRVPAFSEVVKALLDRGARSLEHHRSARGTGVGPSADQDADRVVIERCDTGQIDDRSTAGMSHRAPNDCIQQARSAASHLTAWPHDNRATVAPGPRNDRGILILHTYSLHLMCNRTRMRFHVTFSPSCGMS